MNFKIMYILETIFGIRWTFKIKTIISMLIINFFSSSFIPSCDIWR